MAEKNGGFHNRGSGQSVSVTAGQCRNSYKMTVYCKVTVCDSDNMTVDLI